MTEFRLNADFVPAGSQPDAIRGLTDGIAEGERFQTLLGVTGSGKTFTVANVIEAAQRPTLVIAHNKTLAAQLYHEFSGFFPENRVEYFVSYYDYYQPESYLPAKDQYIEKDASINPKIEQMRLAATASVLSRPDTIIVASVSCIYGLGNPANFRGLGFELRKGERMRRADLLERLVDIQYERNDLDLAPGRFRAKGDVIDIVPGYFNDIVRVELFGDEVDRISEIDRVTGRRKETMEYFYVYPARHFDGRKAGEKPYCLLDYFPDDFLMVIDESHQTVPQVRGMYRGDRSRKETLVKYGFRLPSAFDNRPLRFREFEGYMKNVIFVSATPGEYELTHSAGVVEQIIRPTGLVDPAVEVRPLEGQVEDVMAEIRRTIGRGDRVLVTTLTKRLAEELTDFLAEQGIRTRYLHSEINALERTEIIRQLRLGTFDVLVGINLLREGLDIPEVGFVGILDADKEGFLRDARSLIQTIGRAARNVNARVVLYADHSTDSIRTALAETDRRRRMQVAYNEAHNIVPQTIIKPVPAKEIDLTDTKHLPKSEIPNLVIELEAQMYRAAEDLDFERAILLRDRAKELRAGMEK